MSRRPRHCRTTLRPRAHITHARRLRNTEAQHCAYNCLCDGRASAASLLGQAWRAAFPLAPIRALLVVAPVTLVGVFSPLTPVGCLPRRSLTRTPSAPKRRGHRVVADGD